VQRLSEDRSFEEGALYAGKNALIYNSVQEEGNIYTVLKNSSKKYVDNFEVIKGELYYSAQNDQEGKWAQEIGIKVSPYIIIDGELMSSNTNLDLMDKATGTIIIPQNVTKIGDGAFRDLTGLRSIVIPGTVKEIGIDKVVSELLPVDKVEELEKCMKDGKVIFVGDGINDSPVLARADVGIAMGGIGSDSAIEAADAVIMTDEPSKIVNAIHLSKKTMRIVKENIIFAIFIKVLVLILSAFGVSTMWEAVFADVGVSIIAIINALRVLRVKNI